MGLTLCLKIHRITIVTNVDADKDLMIQVFLFMLYGINKSLVVDTR